MLTAGLTVPAESQAAPDQAEIERLYVEGQEKAEAQEFKDAAEVWTRLLILLPESGENQALRESLIINILEAHISAYQQIVGSDGKKDPAHLQRGKQTLERYYGDFQAVHGTDRAVSAAVAQTASELERLIADTQESDESVVEPVPATSASAEPDTQTSQQANLSDTGPRSGNDDGLGLILGGAGLSLLGLGASVLIPVGGVAGQQADRDHSEAQERLQSAMVGSMEETDAQRDLDDALDRGNRANALLISGAVVGPLLIGGGVTLVVLGLRKRKRSGSTARTRPSNTLTASPSWSPNYRGFALAGRF